MDRNESLNLPDVPYLVHEEEQARSERREKRWFVAWILTFMALILTNIGWIVYENQFEDITTTVSQETSAEGGGNAIINGDRAGAVIYGESETDGYN